MAARDDFLAWFGSGHRDAEVALHNGDAGPRLATWSTHEPLTLMGAWFSAREPEVVRGAFPQLAQTFSDCTSYEFDLVAVDVSGDLAYTVGYEHTSVSIHGEPRRVTLRVTQVYRREAGDWKVVHRHADAETPVPPPA